MIMSLTEIKQFLNITDTSQDTLIESFMPIVEDTIINYCNNDFIDFNYTYFSDYQVEFKSSDNTINFNVDVDDKSLYIGDTIKCFNSLRNKQNYTITAIETNKITVDDVNVLKDELENETIYINRVEYPLQLKIVVAKMIKYNLEMDTNKDSNVSSEKIDDYSINYNSADEYIFSYPTSIMKGLNSFRLVYRPNFFERNCLL